MCGIGGFSGRFSAECLDQINKAIAHRGPDDTASVMLQSPGATVGLTHRRLSIIDLSVEGRQPMGVDCEACRCQSGQADDDRLWLIYNGELYNYPELRRGLEARGHRFHSRTDSEVLLHLYAEEGPEMLGRLNGIFALAIYDGRRVGLPAGIQPGDLLLARDGIGVKPLYFAETVNGFLFSSELKALLGCPGVSKELNPLAIHYYLSYLWAPAPHTPLQGVSKVLPGEAMVIRQGHVVRRWTYYDLPYGQPWLQGTALEVAEQLRANLEDAVARQLMADVPVGAFLSGGLDSSSIVAVMRRLRPDDRIRCYTIGFSGDRDVEGNPSDLPYARRVADHLGVDLHTIEVEPGMIRHLESMIYYLDEPQADPAPINSMLIARQARQDGIKVLMSGAGGDDIFSGYRRHIAQTYERMWTWLPESARTIVAAPARRVANGDNPLGVMGHPLVRRLAKVFAYTDRPPDQRTASYFLWSGELLRRSLYSSDFRQALGNSETLTPLLRSLERIPTERDSLNRMLYLEAKHFLADHNLNYTDKTSMAYGVEVRVPLLDLEMVSFATRIPPSMKQKGRLGKAIFKKAMEPYLPREVIYRPKSGFGAPLRRWLHHDLRSLVDQILSAETLHRRGIFDPMAVHRLVALDRQGKVDAAYTLFAIICHELWCQMFVDGRAPQELG